MAAITAGRTMKSRTFETRRIDDTVSRRTGSPGRSALTRKGGGADPASDPSPAVVYGGAPALTIGPASFPAATTGVPINAPNLAAAARDLFKGSGLYVGVRASISNTGAAGLKTTLRLTQLQARVVIQDKLF